MANDNRRKRRPETFDTATGTTESAESIRDYVVEKVAEKISEKIERSTAHAVKHADRAAKKAAMKAETLDRLAAHLGALDVWTRVEPAARRPRFTRDDIVDAAVRIADREGFDSVSMRRIATELDAGTMTLYHYVRTKDELLTLVIDAVMGEVVVADDEMPTDWRAAMTLLANRSRAALQQHSWILDITDDPAIGPNSVRHFDQSLQAVDSLPIDLADKIDIVSAIDEYVFGYCLHQRDHFGTGDEGIDDEMIAYVNGLLRTGDYPHLAALAAESGLEAAWSQVEAARRDTNRFERNLNRLLDGFEAGLKA